MDLNEKIQKFFEQLYYNNDLCSFSNCFDYKKGKVDIEDVLKVISENNLQIKVVEDIDNY